MTDDPNPEKADAAEATAELVQKASGILDPGMRSFYVADRLAEMDESLIAEVLRELFRGAAARKGKYQDVLEEGIDPVRIRQALGRFKFSRLYHLANRLGYQDVVSLFSKTRPAKDDPTDDLFQVYGLADKTVGERRFLAKSKDKLVLDKVGYDQSPLVIRQLLQNPRMTEKEVLKISARRPNVPEVLVEIYKSKKWLSRYSIKLALVANPYTPPAVSRALIPFLNRADLKMIADSETLDKGVRDLALRHVRPRAGKKSGK